MAKPLSANPRYPSARGPGPGPGPRAQDAGAYGHQTLGPAGAQGVIKSSTPPEDFLPIHFPLAGGFHPPDRFSAGFWPVHLHDQLRRPQPLQPALYRRQELSDSPARPECPIHLRPDAGLGRLKLADLAHFLFPPGTHRQPEGSRDRHLSHPVLPSLDYPCRRPGLDLENLTRKELWAVESDDCYLP